MTTTQSELPVRPMYLLHVDVNGRQHVEEHWIWGDGILLLAARVKEKEEQNKKAREKDKNAPALANIVVLTKQGYIERRFGKR